MTAALCSPQVLEWFCETPTGTDTGGGPWRLWGAHVTRGGAGEDGRAKDFKRQDRQVKGTY